MFDERRLRDEEQFALLHEGFDSREVGELSIKGKKSRYIKTQTVQNRLDDVFGPAGWSEHYQVLDDASAVCTLTVTMPDGRVVTRQGVGVRKLPTPHLKPTDLGFVKPGDVGLLWQTAFSNALKVAARKLGVGRYLKGAIPSFVRPALERMSQPAQPAIAATAPAQLPMPGPAVEPKQAALPAPPPEPAAVVPPTRGQRFFNWVSEQGRANDFDLVKYLAEWGRKRGNADRLVNWSDKEIELGWKEAKRRLNSLFSQELPEDAAAE